MAVDLIGFAQDAKVGAAAERLATALLKVEVRPRAAEPSRAARRVRRMPGVWILETLGLRRVLRAARDAPVVFGSGVVFAQDTPRPYLLADESVTHAPSGELVSVFEEPVVLERVMAALGDRPHPETLVLPVPPPTLHFAPGHIVNGPGRGTFGR
jgi:hypothetical protein